MAATSARSLRLPGRPGGEAAVDLERVERHAAQQPERRPTGPEVVERDRDAELPHGAQHVRQPVDILDALALGQLHEQAARVEARAAQGVLDARGEVALQRVARRDVDADRDGLPVQSRQLQPHATRLRQCEALDLGDQPGLLGQRHELERRHDHAAAPPAQQGLDVRPAARRRGRRSAA